MLHLDMQQRTGLQPFKSQLRCFNRASKGSALTSPTEGRHREQRPLWAVLVPCGTWTQGSDGGGSGEK